MDIWKSNKNFAAYHAMEKELIAKYYGQWAVFCDGRLVGVDNDLTQLLQKSKIPKKKEIFVMQLFPFSEQFNNVVPYELMGIYQ